MARIVIPGGTGYLGQSLAEHLVARGDDVVLLTRGPPRSTDGWRAVTWDATTVGDWVEEIEGADAIVHLSGRRVDTRASRRNIDELISSRVQPVGPSATLSEPAHPRHRHGFSRHRWRSSVRAATT